MVYAGGLLTRKRVIKVALEDEKGSKVAGTIAGFAYDLEIDTDAVFEPRKGTGRYRGHTEAGIIEAKAGVCSFRAEIRGNGTNAMDPFIAACLQACALKNTAETYQVHSAIADDKCLSIDVWEDGVKKGLAGAMGNLLLDGLTGKRLFAIFNFRGRWEAPIYEALPSQTPGTEIAPLLAGGTFTLGGDSLKTSSFGFDLGNVIVPRLDKNAADGIAHFEITDNDPVVSIDPEADLVANHDFYGKWLAGTEGALSLILGTGAGKQITIAAPKVQYRELKGGDREGLKIYDLTGQCNHDSGDDAFSIAAATA